MKETVSIEEGEALANQQTKTEKSRGVKVERYFTKPGKHPFESIKWETRDATIKDAKGNTVFSQQGVEVPSFWSQTATNIVVSKYFRGKIGTEQRESSAKQLIGRVSRTIASWGVEKGYFATEEDSDSFENELAHILINQHAAFNSPVWFNVGVEAKPQCSACFINSVKDDMQSILNLAVTEGMLFKYGSGTGSNLSVLRSAKETLSGGGKASGPLSFMKGFDSFAGAIKSGGKTRRAAKMVILNIDHPDVVDFIMAKAREEKKAWALIDAGYDGSIDGDAYGTIQYQNANHSVRATDEFMKAVVADKEWSTKYITNGKIADTYKAGDLIKKIAEATHICGDPGMQFDTTINKWHTSPNSGRINGSNPCVTGDTKVLTEEGRWIRIDKFLGKETNIITNLGTLGDSKIKGSFETGFKPVYKLTTKNGYELKLTADHKVFTVNRGFIPAAELTKDDRIFLPGENVAELEELENSTFYQMLGIYLGDGCYAKGKRGEGIQLTMDSKRELDILNKFAGYVAESYQRDTHKNSPATISLTQTSGKYTITNTSVINEFRSLVDLSLKGHEKVLSDQIFELPLSAQRYVLQGLFTADGTVANYGGKSQYVALDSTSLQLLKDVQIMLLGFGIKSKLYTDRRAGKLKGMLPDGKGGLKEYEVKEMHSLRISRFGRVKFEKLIGFMPESSKAGRLQKLNQQVGVYKDLPIDPVVSLEYIGEETVYDLTEPITHSFVANGITIHNCSEYMFLDDTACNLSSINLLKCRNEKAEFDVEKFKHIVKVMTISKEIIVGSSSYPTPAIEKNSHTYRTLGLGYANLGALLMSRGLAYDSEDGRNFAAAITSLMSGYAYYISAKMAEAMGPCEGYKVNDEPFRNVIKMHRDAAYKVESKGVPKELLEEGKLSWDLAHEHGSIYGFRNCQISVLAPTGTIAFLMDCDTTGIEPDIALVKYKWLVGGGTIKIVNNTVPEALRRLDYNKKQVDEILGYLKEKDTIEGAPHITEEHLSIFDCAFKPANGTRSIHHMGHVKMIAAVQPFISGAISKTVNVPETATVEEIAKTYIAAWKLGVKAIAIYRDGSKRTQPLTTKVKEKEGGVVVVKSARRRLPQDHDAKTHKFRVGNHEGYLTIGLYEDGSPGEIFINMSKEGSTISGLMDSFSIAVSLALQHGTPLKILIKRFINTRFEPYGYTSNPNIRVARSIVDYIFRWLGVAFLEDKDLQEMGIQIDGPQTQQETKDYKQVTIKSKTNTTGTEKITFDAQSDAPTCSTCGSLMIRSGACYLCFNCGQGTSCAG